MVQTNVRANEQKRPIYTEMHSVDEPYFSVEWRSDVQ